MSERFVVEASLEDGLVPSIPLEQIEAVVHFALDAEEVATAELSIAFVGDPTISSNRPPALRSSAPTLRKVSNWRSRTGCRRW